MKHIFKVLLICGLVLLSLPANARADAMAKDDFMAVSSGSTHTLALRSNGDLWAWGHNSHGQIGNGGESDSIDRQMGYPCQAQPVLVLDNVTAISAGETHSLAIRDDGSLWGWGSNSFGELGLGELEQQNKPVKIMEGVALAAAGANYSLILKTDGTLWACGYNERGQLGNGGLGNAKEAVYDEPIQTEPVQIMDEVKAIAAGAGHALAVKEDGSLWGWGLSENGRLGNGGKSDSTHERYGAYQSIPVRIFESGVVSVAASATHSLAVMEDGALWGWGNNDEGFLLDSGEKIEGIITTPQMLLEGVNMAAAGAFRTFAIKDDGNLWAWGDNYEQALNYNYKADYMSATPHQVMANVADVSSGGAHTMAVLEDGTLWGWGNNDCGQLAEPPGAVGLPVRVKVEYPAWADEPEPEQEAEPEPEEEPLPVEPEKPNPLPFIIGCGVLGVGGITGGLVWRHKKRALGGVSKWRE